MASSKEYLDYVLEQLSELDNIEDKDFLRELVEAMYDELPAPKKKRK